jgi:O-acetyl-ADP-ribose deacetylase
MYFDEKRREFQEQPFEDGRSKSMFEVPLTEWKSSCATNRLSRREHYRVDSFHAFKDLTKNPPTQESFVLSPSGRIQSIQLCTEMERREGIRVFFTSESVTKFEVDAVINAANESLLGGGGVDKAIHDASGPLLIKECGYLHGCEVGGAVITKGYDLPACYVLHTVGPLLLDDGSPDRVALNRCYQSCFDLCEEHKLTSIAVCCISCGFYGFPVEESARVVKTFLSKYAMEAAHRGAHPVVETVVLSLFSDLEYNAYRLLFERG